MALNYCEALLLHLKSISGDNYPGTKITPPGFLEMLANNPDKPRTIGEAFQNGHRRSVRIAYKVRSVEGQVQTTDTCDISLTNIYKETTADVSSLVRLGIYLPEDEIRKYCDDASHMQAFGTPPTMLMNEHIDAIMHNLNGLYAKMNSALLTSQSTQFGVNKNTGLTTARTVNISKDATVQSLASGLAEVLGDAQDNEMHGQLQIVGNGNFRQWDLLNNFKTGQNMFGIADQSMAGQYKFYNDTKSATGWGANQIGVFAPNSVHLIEYMKNVGNFAGIKAGGSSIFSMFTDPMIGLRWDMQLKYYDCPTTVTNAYTGGSQSIDRGWVLILSKNYGYFTTPTDSFDGGDVLAGVNGTLRYSVTNTCDAC